MNLLEKMVQLEERAQNFGLCWESSAQIMAQILSEYHEVSEHLQMDANQDRLKEEIGDLLHAVFSLCVFCQLNPIQTVKESLDKFEKRLKAVELLASEQGLDNLKGHSFAELMSYWRKAKALVG
ncbi:MAG: MazG nucleotide pyrophosphohydrolase domain-containing protein [Legionella sp.]